MKKFVHIILFTFALQIQAQTTSCYLNIDSVQLNGRCYLNPDTITLCHSDSIYIFSSALCLDSVFFDNFNIGNLHPSWITDYPVMLNNPCGTGPDGIYVWFGPDTTINRQITAGPFQINGLAYISFDMKYASQAGNTPCEGPDESTDGVHLQWSNSENGPWSDINYWNPAGGYNPLLTSWNHYQEIFPINGICYFRWYQANYTAPVYDHWGIDNVKIEAFNNTSFNIEWTENNIIFSDSCNIALFPLQTTVYNVTYESAGFILQDSLNVIIPDSLLIISGLGTTYYENSPLVTIGGFPQPGYFTGNGIIQPDIFSPILAGVGIHDITWHYFFTGNNNPQIPEIVFEDNFSTDKGWTGYGQGGWERDTAQASNGCAGNQDPYEDHSPGNDNYLAGNYIGGCYENNLLQTFWLTSPVIDCSEQSNCILSFYSHTGVEASDKIKISVYNGSGWQNIYSNTTYVNDNIWSLETFNIPQATGNAHFQIRFGLGPTDTISSWRGWNIDDVSVSCSGFYCEHTLTQTVTVLSHTGIFNNNSNSDFMIFPNPAENTVFILSPDTVETECRIRDIYGRVILTERITGASHTVNLEKLSSGTYFLQINEYYFTLIKK